MHTWNEEKKQWVGMKGDELCEGSRSSANPTWTELAIFRLELIEKWRAQDAILDFRNWLLIELWKVQAILKACGEHPNFAGCLPEVVEQVKELIVRVSPSRSAAPPSEREALKLVLHVLNSAPKQGWDKWRNAVDIVEGWQARAAVPAPGREHVEGCVLFTDHRGPCEWKDMIGAAGATAPPKEGK